MNQPNQQPTNESLQQALREHCLKEVRALDQRIGEAAECLKDGNHLGALGALTGIDDELRELTTALKLIQRLPDRK